MIKIIKHGLGIGALLLCAIGAFVSSGHTMPFPEAGAVTPGRVASRQVAPGQVEFVLGGVDQLSHCAIGTNPLGEFTLDGLDNPARLRVAGEELMRHGRLRHELPAGVYSLTWTSRAAPDAPNTPALWLHRPTSVSVLSGQMTTLRINRMAAACLEAVASGAS